MSNWYANTPTQDQPNLPERIPSAHPTRVLLLHGSLQESSVCRQQLRVATAALEAMGCDVRVFHADRLPPEGPGLEDHPEVVRLREASLWSEAQVWCLPATYGAITGLFRNQLAWLPTSLGSVSPTAGKVVAVMQSGRPGSFDAAPALRRIGRSKRMIVLPHDVRTPDPQEIARLMHAMQHTTRGIRDLEPILEAA